MEREKRQHRARVVRAAFYLRRSERESDTNYSIQTQERVCREKADRTYGRDGYVVVDILRDEGRSGTLGVCMPGTAAGKCRPGLTRLVELVDAGKLDGVVVYKLDRLARRLRLLLSLLEDHFVPKGVDLLSAGEEIDVTSSHGKLSVQLLGVIAEWYSRQAADRTRDGIRNRRAQGYAVGQAPYGWRLQTREEAEGNRRTLTRDPKEGKWLLHMRERLFSGLGCHRIAEELDRIGVRTKTGAGKWSSSSVYRSLLNPAHAGLVLSEDGLVPATFGHERYWDEDARYRITAEIESHRRVPSMTKAAGQYLLTQALHCHGCGHRMYGLMVPIKGKGHVPYYWCRTKPRQPGCHSSMIPAGSVESAVVEALREIALGDELQTLSEEAMADILEISDRSLVARQSHISRRLAEIDDQLDRWADQLTRGKVPQERFDAFQEKLWKERETCESEFQQVRAEIDSRSTREAQLEEVRENLRNFDAIWGGLDEDQRRHLVRTLIERCTLEWRDMDSILVLKPLGLPERKLIVRCRSRRRRRATSGIEALTARQLALLHLLDEGMARDRIARQMGVTEGVIASYVTAIRKRVGIKEIARVIDVARPLIRQRLHLLPLEGRAVKRPSQAHREPNELVKGALRLRAETGASLTEIARNLGCNPRSLPVYLSRWRRQLGVTTVDELVSEAQRRDWIPRAAGGETE